MTLLTAGAPLVAAPTASAQGCKPLPNADCRGVDFSKEDVIVFTGSDETPLDLKGGNFRGANLSGKTITNVTLDGAHLEGANLTNVTFVKTTIKNGFLEGARLDGAKLLTGSTLMGSDVSKTVMMPVEVFAGPWVTLDMVKATARPIAGTWVSQCEEDHRLPVLILRPRPYNIWCTFADDGDDTATGRMKIWVYKRKVLGA
jgi:hypothetical protein